MNAVTLTDQATEQRILGILIKHPDRLDDVADRLTEEHFVHPQHKQIYRAILELYRKDGRISYTLVYNRLRKEIPGIDQVLIRLTESFVALGELEPSVKLLQDSLRRRKIIAALQRAQEEAATLEDVDELAGKVQEAIFAATKDADTEEKELPWYLTETLRDLEERKQRIKEPGLPVGLRAIDGMTHGFRRGDLIVLAARPSMGKTALALKMVRNACRTNKRTALFSLEMSGTDIIDRLLISESGVNAEAYAAVPDMEIDYNAVEAARSRIYKWPLVIRDQRGLSVNQIRAKARREAAKQKLDLVVIDYLQLIRPPERDRNYTLIVGEMVRELRDMAAELNLPVILLSQLNRGVTKRDNKRPTMADLRDSGNIEEFADVIILLHREEYYDRVAAEKKNLTGICEVIFEKQRKGRTGSRYLEFYPERQEFFDIDQKRLDLILGGGNKVVSVRRVQED